MIYPHTQNNYNTTTSKIVMYIISFFVLVFRYFVIGVLVSLAFITHINNQNISTQSLVSFCFIVSSCVAIVDLILPPCVQTLKNDS